MGTLSLSRVLSAMLITSMIGTEVRPLGASAFADPPRTGPSPADIERARSQGTSDGRPDGEREGRDRGPEDGRREGQREGRERGYRECFERERDRARDAGYHTGYQDGQNQGNREGLSRGAADGDSKGLTEGRNDGLRRADRDADRAASPLGRDQGYAEAERTDANARGYADGLVAGDKRALKEAQDKDYPRGRVDYRNERFNEAIENRDSFSQRPSPFNSIKIPGVAGSLSAMRSARDNTGAFNDNLRLNGRANPDYRYSNPRKTFASPEENNAYQSAYRQAYADGFRGSYDSAYRNAFDREFRDGQRDGCRDAERQDFRRYYDEGYTRGHDEGYSVAYRSAYDSAYRHSYDISFRNASDRAYDESYDSYYHDHFESARRAAYSERVGQLYNAGFARGDLEKFNQMYPTYAAQEYARGRADEDQDFAQRPVRMLGAQATETVLNGLFEPGEHLRVKVQLRNFAASALANRDIVLKVQAVDANGVIVSEPEATLVRGLRAKSQTEVNDALQFTLTDAVVNRATQVVVTAFYQGRNVGMETIRLTAKYWVQLEFAETPRLLEGLEATLKVKVRNQSPNTETGLVKLEVLSNSQVIQLVRKDAAVNTLAAGETKVVEFVAIARSPEAAVRAPLAFLATTSTGRRIGVMDFTGSVPLINDYRINVEQDVSLLRKPGITRVPYRIRNISSRLLFKGLQLKARIIDADDATNFKVLGPNPQYLTPLENGQLLTFVIPVMANTVSRGATIELEVQEDGRTTVIHQLNFKE